MYNNQIFIWSTQFGHALQQSVGVGYKVSVCVIMFFIEYALVIFIDVVYLGYENNHTHCTDTDADIKL